jgi:hypothetical protein
MEVTITDILDIVWFETSLNHSFKMFFNVSRVHCDNYCEILTIEPDPGGSS